MSSYRTSLKITSKIIAEKTQRTKQLQCEAEVEIFDHGFELSVVWKAIELLGMLKIIPRVWGMNRKCKCDDFRSVISCNLDDNPLI